MRRPVMYLAGLLLATGASLALAGPAQAADSHRHKCHHHSDSRYDYVRDYDRYDRGPGSLYYSSVDSHNAYGLIAVSDVLNGNHILGL